MPQRPERVGVGRRTTRGREPFQDSAAREVKEGQGSRSARIVWSEPRRFGRPREYGSTSSPTNALFRIARVGDIEIKRGTHLSRLHCPVTLSDDELPPIYKRSIAATEGRSEAFRFVANATTKPRLLVPRRGDRSANALDVAATVVSLLNAQRTSADSGNSGRTRANHHSLAPPWPHEVGPAGKARRLRPAEDLRRPQLAARSLG
jgi:hypothetical protein